MCYWKVPIFNSHIWHIRYRTYITEDSLNYTNHSLGCLAKYFLQCAYYSYIMKNQLLLVLLLMVGGFVFSLAAQISNAIYETRVLETTRGVVCSAAEQREMTRNLIRNETRTILHERVLPPASTSAPTHGYGYQKGLTRITFIDMTNTSQQCPSAWTYTNQLLKAHMWKD